MQKVNTSKILSLHLGYFAGYEIIRLKIMKICTYFEVLRRLRNVKKFVLNNNLFILDHRQNL